MAAAGAPAAGGKLSVLRALLSRSRLNQGGEEGSCGDGSGAGAGAGAGAGNASIHRHQGFELYARRTTPWLWDGGQMMVGWRKGRARGKGKRNDQVRSAKGELDRWLERWSDRCDAAEVRLEVVAWGPAGCESLTRSVTQGLRGGYVDIRSVRTEMQGDGSGDDVSMTMALTLVNRGFTPTMRESKFYRYAIPPPAEHAGGAEERKQSAGADTEADGNVDEDPNAKAKADTPGLTLFTREAPLERKIRKEDIVSHELHGVDNTGNVRVWFCEHVLLHVMLSGRFGRDLSRKSLLEIGGGMTALAGLGVAARLRPQLTLLTDGHPTCVTNQRVCIQMNAQAGEISRARTQAARLLWSRSDTSTLNAVRTLVRRQAWRVRGRSRGRGRGRGKRRRAGAAPAAAAADDVEVDDEVGDESARFDLIIGADCLFFKEFHDDLVFVLDALLSHAEGAAIVLVQPRRGDSMDVFLEHVAAVGGFDAEVVEDFDAHVSALHEQFLSENADSPTSSASNPNALYDPNVHRPLLVVLTRARVGEQSDS